MISKSDLLTPHQRKTRENPTESSWFRLIYKGRSVWATLIIVVQTLGINTESTKLVLSKIHKIMKIP